MARVDVYGPGKEIPDTDVGTDSGEMGWLMDKYSKARGMTVS